LSPFGGGLRGRKPFSPLVPLWRGIKGEEAFLPLLRRGFYSPQCGKAAP